MRILIKGGVWKNTEDEILKAAVMKYGKNQWARVASLMNRKSAKQCKARWYEWLDPSIKKTEWSKPEEEKLLHLAKLMPNQWRTIAPIVGRTAGQCMEHYERLLDMAQDGASADGASAADDPRRLRPGEIDPTPETKPARPDPIDMDEDEKEMLSEARARLANTQGKKAKRKARERQMDDARRLAALQKRRELKAAGVQNKVGTKKRNFINYATEIPFQKAVPAGFYDVNEEIAASRAQKLDPAKDGLEISKMEGRHRKEEEEKAKAKDRKYMKKLFADNAPEAILKVSEVNDPVNMRRRVPLALPRPQVSDAQLEDIVKASSVNSLMPPPQGMLSGGRGSSSQLLLGEYSNSSVGRAAEVAGGVSQRTPLQEDVIMQEARNLRHLREMTPMSAAAAGTELAEMYEGTGFQGIAPRKHDLATPNTLLDRGASTVHGGGNSAGSRTGPGNTPMIGGGGRGFDEHESTISTSNRSSYTSAPPIRRDHFGLNTLAAANFTSAAPDTYSEVDIDHSDDVSVMSSRFGDGNSVMSRIRQQKELGIMLNALPKPEFTYEVDLPTMGAEHEEEDGVGSGAVMVEDAADMQERLRAEREHEAALNFKKRSSVVRRGLWCPTTPAAYVRDQSEAEEDATAPKSKKARISAPAVNTASPEALVQQEMIKIVMHDAFQYSEENDLAQFKISSTDYVLEDFSVEEIAAARSLIVSEAAPFFDSKEGESYLENFVAQWEDLHKSMMYVPDGNAPGGGIFTVPKNKSELLSALTAQFMALKTKIDKDVKKADKVETKIQILSQGYLARANSLQDQLMAAINAVEAMHRQVVSESFQRDGEMRFAQAARIEAMREEVQRAESEEAEAQKQYALIVSFAKSLH